MFDYTQDNFGSILVLCTIMGIPALCVCFWRNFCCKDQFNRHKGKWADKPFENGSAIFDPDCKSIGGDSGSLYIKDWDVASIVSNFPGGVNPAGGSYDGIENASISESTVKKGVISSERKGKITININMDTGKGKQKDSNSAPRFASTPV